MIVDLPAVRVAGRISSWCVLAIAVAMCGSRDDRRDLRKAYAAQTARPVELRLADFDYVPRAARTRGSERGREPQLAAAAYAALANSAADASTRALSQLLTGQSAVATETFRSLAQQSQTASAWSDLAAVLHDRGQADGDVHLLLEALAATDRALRLDANSQAARFNRAAALETLGWHAAARQAWIHYLRTDATSGWATEARARMRELQEPTSFRTWRTHAKEKLERAVASGNDAAIRTLVSQFPQEARTTAETIHLAQWGRALREDRMDDARRFFTIAKRVGDVLAERDERLLYDAVAAAAARPEVSARAHVRYDEARLLIHRRNLTAALAAIADAEDLFAEARSPMELVARYYRAGVLFDLDRGSEGAALLDTITREQRPHYRALEAQVLWELSLRALRNGRPFASLAPSEAAVALFRSLGETNNQIRVLTNHSAALTQLGRDEEAWRIRGELFRLAGGSGHPDVVEAVLHAAGFAAVQEERFDIAYSLFQILSSSAEESPVRRYDVALLRAYALVRLGDATPHELDDLAAAARGLPDPRLQESAEDERNYLSAIAISSTNSAEAIHRLTRSIEYRERKRLATLADTYAARGKAHTGRGDVDAAVRDFEEALSTYEKASGDITAGDLRDSFFSWADESCSSLVNLYMKRRDAPRAFASAERCRARVLGEGAPDHNATTPPSTLLLHYNVLERCTIVFAVRGSDITAVTLDRGLAEISAMVSRVEAAIQQRNADDAAHSLRELSGLLLQPFDDALRSAAEVVVVPDEILARVPFTALTTTGKPLIETHLVTIAPSARAWFSRAKRGRRADHPVVTAIADPAFDRGAAGERERLPATRREAEVIRQLYRSARVLSDREATPQRALRAFAESDIVHVGTHAIVSQRDAALSVLALAPDGNDGLLTLREIRAQRLKRQPLVILAGCRTAAWGPGKGSIRSLGAAFLAAGASGVIATLWDVGDVPAQMLMTRFHESVSRGVPPKVALRQAQTAMLTSSNPELRKASTWSAFQYYE